MAKPARPTWFVTFVRRESGASNKNSRSSKTFPNEADAKAFALGMVGKCGLTAGTINPHIPKRFIGSEELAAWLAESD